MLCHINGGTDQVAEENMRTEEGCGKRGLEKIEEDQMVRACSTNGREANYIVCFWKTKSILSGTKVGLHF